MSDAAISEVLPPLVVPCAGEDLEELLGREWLLTNRIGAYASATIPGTNTRQYHGLLVAATKPPGGRVLALSAVMDQLIVPAEEGQTTYDLATFEFPGTFNPCGAGNLVEFRHDVAATFLYRCGPAELVKEIILAETANAVAVRYRLLSGPACRLRIRPFLA
ncbi:hypothetical protein LCGC14_2165290, partial [marine sediment metagenome]